jgi:hypothetical protein
MEPSSKPTSQSGLGGLVQKDMVRRPTGSAFRGVHPDDPADSTTLRLRKTAIRNGETPRRLSGAQVDP